MIINMGVAFFIVHNGVPLSDKEMALIYLIIFVCSFISGPGRYSVDHIFLRKCCNRNDEYKEVDFDD
jgi:putative oxidoreductase